MSNLQQRFRDIMDSILNTVKDPAVHACLSAEVNEIYNEITVNNREILCSKLRNFLIRQYEKDFRTEWLTLLSQTQTKLTSILMPDLD